MSVRKKTGRSLLFVRAGGHCLWVEYLTTEAAPAWRQPTLIFLHEGLGSIAQWKEFPLLLGKATGLPVLIYDRWGHGRSEGLTGPRHVQYLHDEALKTLPEILDYFDITDTILIGHSDGGSIALLFAAEHPDRVSGVITEAAHVFVEEITVEGIRQAVHIFETSDFSERLRAYHGENTESLFYGWANVWLSREFRNWNIERYLSKVTCPVLAIQGSDDEYGTPAQVESIVRNVKGAARGLLIPECGHTPHHQARDRTLATMKEFILELINVNVPGECASGKPLSLF